MQNDERTDYAHLNHADVVGTISDSQSHNTKPILDEVDDERFLQRRHSATYDGLTFDSQLEE